jgi:coenzyme F420-0:L-glutamate ligase/coenzyme F420-1:gamma-L-glutamate ligase
MTVELIPLTGLPEVPAGAELAGLIAGAVERSGLRPQDGDAVVVTQKVVSKAEGRVVPEGPDGKLAWVAREARRIVARRGDLVIAETHHGFVCANAGVDASNVAEGYLSLLPEDPDASAERIRAGLVARLGVSLGVVVTDTFGRPWRRGLVNVAIGCAGLPALVDLRGTEDATGRLLEVTVVALADEVAAASGLVMGKAEGVPVAVVRGVRPAGRPGKAVDLVRPAAEDLFRTSPLEALCQRQAAGPFAATRVPPELVEEAVGAALAAFDDGDEPSLQFAVARTRAARMHLAPDGIVAAGGEVPGEGPALIVPIFMAGGGGHGLFDDKAHADAGAIWPKDADLVRSGRAVQNLVLALRGQGLVATWHGADPELRDRIAFELPLGDGNVPLGLVVAGYPLGDQEDAQPGGSHDAGKFISMI